MTSEQGFLRRTPSGQELLQMVHTDQESEWAWLSLTQKAGALTRQPGALVVPGALLYTIATVERPAQLVSVLSVTKLA